MTKEAAEAALQTAIEKRSADEARRQAVATKEAELTLAKYFALWIEEHAARRCAPKTLERYTELGQYLTREIGMTPLNELSTSQIQKQCTTSKITEARRASSIQWGGRCREDSPPCRNSVVHGTRGS